MTYPTLEQLLEAGVHFGHVSSRWNPKMQPYIFATRDRIHVINLERTLEKLKEAAEYVRDVASRGGTVVFIGTKRQAKDVIKKAALDCGMPYVTVRWLGGTFTNFRTIQRTVKKLEKFQQMQQREDFDTKYTKKERLMIEREIAKLTNLFEGIKTMKKLPEAVFVVDMKFEEIAVREAKKSGVKVIGIVDTNADPDKADYVVPSNDDSIKAITLIANVLSEAAKEGNAQMAEQSTPSGKEQEKEKEAGKDSKEKKKNGK